jgi:crossover junction endodeoxyribonuclease RuvC|tara:strand:+ start:124 stop:618 length:495 start_codon:yes stop_codon:yes gene_type:complete
MYIIGIDPGISGAICFFENGQILDVIDMPTMTDGKKNKKQVNASQLVNEIKKRIINIPTNRVSVVVEHVTAMPGQGVTSMFNFGQSFGAMKGICAALNLSIFFVRPAKWKKYFNLINTQKDASRTRVIEIFPYMSPKLSKKKDANKADAILIASFFNNTFKLID